jgi:hypothetical protein
MLALHHALEAFYDRAAPLGVAFVGPPRLAACVGLPATRFLSLGESANGFVQHHIEHFGVSVYISPFGGGKFLIAQFDFQEDYPPPWPPWLAFVRLAATVARLLEEPEDRDDSGRPASAFPDRIPPRSGFAPPPRHSRSSSNKKTTRRLRPAGGVLRGYLETAWVLVTPS